MGAFEFPVLLQSLSADADLSLKQYYAVKPTATGVALCSVQGENAVGLLRNEPTSGTMASVAIQGIAKGVLGGTVNLWDRLATDSSGKLVQARVGDATIGIAFEAGVASDVIPVLLDVKPSPFDEYWVNSDDLSAKQYYALKADTTAAGSKALLTSATGDRIIGLVQNAPGASGNARIRTFGRSTFKDSGAGVTAGGLLMTNTDGTLLTATGAGKHVVAIALATVAGSATGPCFIIPGGTLDA